MYKQGDSDELLAYLFQQYTQNNLVNYSAMNQLGENFSDVMQHNGKLRLILDLKNVKNKELGLNSSEMYKWETNTQTEEYEKFRKGEGLIIRMWLDQLITTFGSSSSTLLTKFYNLINSN